MPANKSAQRSSPLALKERQQVAAVCYRHHRRGIEFLLVQTRSGRWIFPKGGAEPGLTHAESAALEAFEEAGVHGRMEKIPFARYFHHKPGATAPLESAVTAHLCEVSHLEPPQESNRHPTWFSAEKAKRHLREHRDSDFGDQLTSVIDRAMSRIRRLRGNSPANSERSYSERTYIDGLQKVRIEANERAEEPGLLPKNRTETPVNRYFFRQRNADSSAIEVAVRAHIKRISHLDAELIDAEAINTQPIRPQARTHPLLRLGTGAKSPAHAVRNITAIDTARKDNSTRDNRPSNKRSTLPKPVR